MLKSNSTFYFLALANFATFLNFSSQSLLARILSPEDMGIYLAVVSSANFFFSFFACIPIIITKVVIDSNTHEIAYHTNKILKKKFIIWGSITILILFICSPLIANNLNLNSVTPLLLFYSSFIFSCLICWHSGILQGHFKFYTLTLKDISIASLKLIFIVAFYFNAPKNYFIPLYSDILAIIFTYLWLNYVTKSIHSNTQPQISSPSIMKNAQIQSKKLIKFTVPTALTMWSIGLITSIDILLIKHFYDPKSAGIYATISTIGKIPFFFSGPLIQILIPKTMRLNNQNNNSHSLFYFNIFVTLFFCVIIGIIIFFWGEQIILLLYGNNYQSGYFWLKLHTVSIIFVSLLNVIFNDLLSRERYIHIVASLLYAVSLILYIYTFKATIDQFLKFVIYFNILLFFGLIFAKHTNFLFKQPTVINE